MALAEIEARNMDAAMQKNNRSSVLSMGNAFVEAAKGIAAMALLHEFVKNTVEAQNAMAQLEAAVQSTGGTAGRSVQQLDALSMALQQTRPTATKRSRARSDAPHVRQDSGDEFDRRRAVTDLAARMGGDLQGAACKSARRCRIPRPASPRCVVSGVSFSENRSASSRISTRPATSPKRRRSSSRSSASVRRLGRSGAQHAGRRADRAEERLSAICSMITPRKPSAITATR
jgi:hypothetical protein